MARKSIMVGAVKVGGDAPISVQSMTTTDTSDISSTVAQISQLTGLGCDIIRVAVPDKPSAYAIEEIKKQITIPLVADIHFDHKLALLAIEAGADKIRINPGNIGSDDKVQEIAKLCAAKNIPIRVGVNSGSLSSDILAKHGGVTPDALLDSALEHINLLNKFDFNDICVSVKTSSVPLTVTAYRKLYEKTDYPLHIGITEAGGEYMGMIKSSIGIGALLLDGIGDTIRVSLTASPEHEVKAAIAILKALGKRPGFDIISCPTCGRCNIDLMEISSEIDKRLMALEQQHKIQHKEFNKKISVAVMGCTVNGPGEASRADYGIAGGKSEGIIFKKGNTISKKPMEELVGALIDAITQGENL